MTMYNLYWVFFVIGVFSYFRVRFLIKKLYPKLHSRLFSKKLIEHSVGSSINFISFSMKKRKWSDITDSSLLFWLQLHRVILISFYSITVVAVLYAIYRAISLA